MEARSAAGDICGTASVNLVLSAGDTTVQTAGSTIFFLRRRKLDQEQLYYISDVIKVFIPTPRLISIFEEQRCKMENHRALELFRVLSSHALTRTATGWRYEMEVHKRLCTKAEPLHLYHRGAKMDIHPSTNLLPGTLSGLEQVGQEEHFYWMPSSPNFPGVDSVLGSMFRRELVIFTIQATISSDHKSPAKGFKKVWEAVRQEIRERCTWHYVVVAASFTATYGFVDKFADELNNLGLSRGVHVWPCGLRS